MEKFSLADRDLCLAVSEESTTRLLSWSEAPRKRGKTAYKEPLGVFLPVFLHRLGKILNRRSPQTAVEARSPLRRKVDKPPIIPQKLLCRGLCRLKSRSGGGWRPRNCHFGRHQCGVRGGSPAKKFWGGTTQWNSFFPIGTRFL